MAESFRSGLPPEGRNVILDSLPREVRQSLRRHLSETDLEIRQVLFAEEAGVEGVCFPISCVISRLVGLPDGTTVEVSLAGREGLVGFPAMLDNPWSAFRALVQFPGRALFLPGKEARRLLENARAAEVVFSYLFSVMRETSLNAACARVHSAIQRLSRWLLSLQDRAGADDFPLTQQFLSEMLGVRRESVTLAAQELRMAGAIDYQRGTLRITEPSRLEERACPCYAEIVEGYVRFLRRPS
ncbi:MAG TPA: Crp/Fnr family transcriptional regulator [Actinomycetota bacterium]|nr:Crp/Fnr family transcriptional regulator [Actinomycetota bacterium]